MLNKWQYLYFGIFTMINILRNKILGEMLSDSAQQKSSHTEKI